jgi:uncharacterized protein (TIGR04141 family)
MAASQKRSSTALWKVAPVEGGGSPRRQLSAIRETYAELSRRNPRRYPPIVPVGLRQRLDGVRLDLYVRNRSVAGWSDFIEPYLKNVDDIRMFPYRAVETALARALDTLPAAPEEQLRKLAFLDNLYLVRSSKLTDELKAQLFENLRLAALHGEELDIDISDPNDVAAFQTGSSFKLSRWALDGDPSDIDDVLSALRECCGTALADADAFAQKLGSMGLSYSQETQDDSIPVRRDAWKFMHGQVDLGGQTYFLLDANWYQVKGDYLSNLKRDFLDEVFAADEPIYLGEDIGLLEWTQSTERAYNAAQADLPGFYLGMRFSR